jgi:hypothetical protein
MVEGRAFLFEFGISSSAVIVLSLSGFQLPVLELDDIETSTRQVTVQTVTVR